MKALFLLALAATAPDYALFDSVLQKYVPPDGKVRYQALKDDSGDLDRFVAEVAAVSPDSNPALFPTREARLAYWINAYNALVLKSFSAEYPKSGTLGSLIGRAYFFYHVKHNVGGSRRTLDDIEVKSIRKPFHEPRIHFTIVCASANCPWLSPHAYTPANVDSKLEEETRYFAQPRNFAIDREKRNVTLPAILDWFKEDFGGTPDKILAFVARYRPAESADLTKETWQLRYFDYNWSPNDAP